MDHAALIQVIRDLQVLVCNLKREIEDLKWRMNQIKI